MHQHCSPNCRSVARAQFKEVSVPDQEFLKMESLELWGAQWYLLFTFRSLHYLSSPSRKGLSDWLEYTYLAMQAVGNECGVFGEPVMQERVRCLVRSRNKKASDIQVPHMLDPIDCQVWVCTSAGSDEDSIVYGDFLQQLWRRPHLNDSAIFKVILCGSALEEGLQVCMATAQSGCLLSAWSDLKPWQ